MSVIPIYLDERDRVRQAHTYSVWLRDPEVAWGASCWVTDTELEPEQLSLGVGTHIDRCVLRQRYGTIKDRWQTGASEAYQLKDSYDAKNDLLWHYIKVQITPDLRTVADNDEKSAVSGMENGDLVYQTDVATVYRYDTSTSTWTSHETPRSLTWYGLITNVRREAMGGDVLGETGDLVIEAMGLEVLLTRTQIRSTTIEDTAGGGSSSTIEIDRAVPFNGQRGARQMGDYQFANCTTSVAGTPVFALQFDTAELWTSNDIVKYLLEYHSPNDANGPTWTLASSASTLLSLHSPLDVQTDGRTLWDIVNEIVNRKRGVCWWLAVDDDGVEMQVASLDAYGVTLPSGASVPANENRRTLDISTKADVVKYTENYDALRQYSQVIVEGGFQGAVFTISYADDTLEDDWSAAESDDYSTAGSERPDYSLLDLSEQKTVNDSIRSSDLLRHVYTRLRVPLDWDGKAKNGEGASSPYRVFPKIDDDDGAWSVDPISEASGGHAFWRAGMKFESYLPLKEQWNFATDSYQPEDKTKSGSLAEYRRPFAAICTPRTNGGDFWLYADTGGWANGDDELREGRRVSCTLKMHSQQLGLTLTPHGPPHTLSGTVEWDGYSNPVSHLEQGRIDYQKTIFTVYCRSDHRNSVRYPADDDVETVGNSDNVHVIRLGDRARVDCVIPGTVVEVSNGELHRTTTPMLARDDRPYMLDLAAQAYSWYATPRVAINLAVRNVSNQFQIGDIVTYVHYGNRYITTASTTVLLLGDIPALRDGGTDRAINSTITAIDIDLLAGTTRMRTDYAEIDFESEV